MNNLLGIYCFIRNGLKFDYPFIESIESAVPIANQIVINECDSEDDTLNKLLELKEKYPEKIKIIRDNWVTHHSQLCARGNLCIPYLTTQWHWQLQADEVLHEKDYDLILKTLTDTPDSIDAYKPYYYHFMANYETEFNFMYVKAARIARKNTGWWLVGDAAEIAGGDPNRLADFPEAIKVFHYGKVKDGKTGWQKEWDFTNLYKDIGFPDPKMKEMEVKFGEQYCDYIYVFEGAIERGEVRHYTGTHPKVMEERIKNFKMGGYEQFISRFKESLDLKNLKDTKLQDSKKELKREEELTENDKNRIYECRIGGKNIDSMENVTLRMKHDWNKRALKDAPFYITGSPNISPEWLRHSGKIDFDLHFLPRFLQLYSKEKFRLPTILEIGCGIGRMSEYIASYCDTLIAADISAEFLEVAKLRLAESLINNVTCLELNGYSLEGISDNSIDLAFEYIVFQHIGSFEIIVSYLKEIGRVLKSGGYFIMHARANDFAADNSLNMDNTFHGCNVTYTMMIDTIKETGNLEIVEHNISNNDYWGIIKKK